MTSPYSNLPNRAFWQSGVSDGLPDVPVDIFQPKFPITRDTRIFTAGSCFAQHVGRALRKRRFKVIDTEAMHGVASSELANRFGYGLYSARFGNIYTIRQFKQLIAETSGSISPAEPVWEKDGRFFDAQRPNVEPGGLPSAEQVHISREFHLLAVAEALKDTEVVVFTFGLTESWEHIKSGTIYPTAPETIAGSFDPAVYRFRNFRYSEIIADFIDVRQMLRDINADIKFVLTVSPVPLTATASGDHVLTASSYSKSVLRAVCGDLAADYSDVDYFPSFELVASHASDKRFFESDKKEVSDWGVDQVMNVFLGAYGAGKMPSIASPKMATDQEKPDEDKIELICEEELLEAFTK